MSDVKFEAVQELVAQQKYAEARMILKTIHEPKAREWEKKLNQLNPQPLAQARSSQIRLLRNISVIGLAVMVVGLLVLNMLGAFSPSLQAAQNHESTRQADWAIFGATQTAIVATDLAIPTQTYTPTPVTIITPIAAQTMYAKSNFVLKTCPRYGCTIGKHLTLGEPVIVIGTVTTTTETIDENDWYVIQVTEEGQVSQQFGHVSSFTH